MQYILAGREVGRRIASRPTEVPRKGLVVDVDEIVRGEIWWADLPEPRRSEPENWLPVLVAQADSFNRSRV